MRKSTAKKLVLLLTAVLCAVLAYGWFFIISPIFVSKPELPKPVLSEVPEVESVNWLVNELEVYKLHSDPLSGEKAEMEIVIMDLNKVYTVVVEDNVPTTHEGPAANPDIRIKLDSVNFAKLYNAQNILDEAVKLYEQGKVEIELLKDETTLVAKGYKVIYDALKG